MEQTDQLSSTTASPATATAAPPRATRALAVPAGLRLLWRYRAFLAGLTALVLALWGETLVRPVGNGPPDPALGTRLLQIAVLLVGLVAWVRDSVRLPGRPTRPAPAADAPRRVVVGAAPAQRTGEIAPHPALSPEGRGFAFPRLSRIGQQLQQIQTRITHYALRIAAARRRVGWRGTVVGLAVVAALGVWGYLLLQQSFAHPLAPWVWAAMLGALALTFVGAGPWPAGAGLLPHDPAEPAQEPPVSRAEWLALGAILLVALLARVWSLDTIPYALYPDEGDRLIDGRHLNRGEPVNQAPYLFFGTGWWGVPSLYFWLVAQSLNVFGDNLFGGRMIHALAGVGAVWFTYRTGRLAWTPRAGLLAAALLAVSDFAIHFSRIGGESTILIFTWAACFYFFYKALKTRRPLDWVLSGLAGGFCLYGYVAGKLLPLCMAVLALYVLGRWGLTGIRRYLPGLALLALAAGLTYAPNGLYVLQNPDAFAGRYNTVAIFSPPVAAQLFGNYNTADWAVILQRQFETAYRVFDVGSERGPFYPSGQPLLPVLWAALFILGTAYLVWRVGDVRFFMLGIWLVGGLAGAALTNDTPTVQRMAALVPLLGLIPAVFLDRVATGAPPLRWRAPLLARGGLPRAAMQGLLLGMVTLLAVQSLAFYFLEYSSREYYSDLTRAGRYVATLDPAKDMVLQAGLPNLWWWLGPAVWLADRVEGRDFGNPSEELPILNDRGKTVHILVFPSNAYYLPILKTYYPGGTEVAITRPGGGLFCTVYKLEPAALAARRQTAARYGPPEGPIFERSELRLGTLAPDGAPPGPAAPAWLAYPLAAEWQGGLVVPAYGTYRLSLLAPAGATLELDGRPLLRVPAGSATAVEARLVLAEGLHTVRLAGTLADPAGQVALRWGTDNGTLVPVARPFLWDGPTGALVGESQPDGAPPDAFTTPTLAFDALPATARRDGVLAWRGVNLELKGGANVFAVWRGTLRAPTLGLYLLDPVTDGPVSLWLDGRLVAGRGVPNMPAGFPARLTLAPGDHALEVRFQATHDNAGFELYWLPPNGERTLLPPTALAPAPGGVWLESERPGVPSPEAQLIGAEAPDLQATPVREIGAQSPWLAARGVAVLPDGRIAVGDSGNHRIIVYRPDGTEERTWGSAGSGDGQFNLISDLAAAPDGTLAVLDADNGDLQLFTGDGQLVAHLPAPALGLSHSSGVAWAPDGTLWVADTGSSRVLHVDRSGAVLGAFRGGADGLAPLEQPVDVLVTPNGTVYVVDFHNRLARLDAAGLVDREWTLPVGGERGGSHLALWIDQIAITNPDSNTLRFLDLGSEVVRDLTPGPAAPAPLTWRLPIGVAAGPDNQLYVLDSDNQRVVVLAR